MIPIAYKDLRDREKREALETISFLKGKRNGNPKFCTCANGKKQRRFVKDTDDWSSPTAQLETILSTFLLDVIEKRAVSTVDIPGVYLHAPLPLDKSVLPKLTNELVDVMREIDL